MVRAFLTNLCHWTHSSGDQTHGLECVPSLWFCQHSEGTQSILIVGGQGILHVEAEDKASDEEWFVLYMQGPVDSGVGRIAGESPVTYCMNRWVFGKGDLIIDGLKGQDAGNRLMSISFSFACPIYLMAYCCGSSIGGVVEGGVLLFPGAPFVPVIEICH